MVGGLRPARSAVQKRNRLLTNSSEMNDYWQLRKIYGQSSQVVWTGRESGRPLGATTHDQRRGNSV
jgi:hypothetical protein